MVSIVGNKINIHQGDESAFRVVYKDKSENIRNFEASDIITLTIRNFNSKEIILHKVSESFIVEGQEVAILRFSHDDYVALPPATYLYDLKVSLSTGAEQTLINRAHLTIVDTDEYEAEIELGRLTSYFSEDIHLSDSSLVCNFNSTKVKKQEAEGTLILFNRLKVNISEDSDEEDSLILYDAVAEDPDEDTLILF